MEIVRNRYLSKLISKMNNGLVKIITGIINLDKKIRLIINVMSFLSFLRKEGLNG